MNNPFDKVYETDAQHAAVLAQAFISAHNVDEMYACLRFVDNAYHKSGGFYAAYLTGYHFMAWTDRNGEIVGSEDFEQLQELAHEFKDSCGLELWRLC